MKLKKQSNFKAHGKYTQLNVYLLSQLILIDKIFEMSDSFLGETYSNIKTNNESSI